MKCRLLLTALTGLLCSATLFAQPIKYYESSRTESNQAKNNNRKKFKRLFESQQEYIKNFVCNSPCANNKSSATRY